MEGLIQARPEPRPESLAPGIAEHIQVDYLDLNCWGAALNGVDVVLSFIPPFLDQQNLAQKSLIDACIKAGVCRFVPSEWAVPSDASNPFFKARSEVRKYLESVNSPNLQLEYTVFQPGLFLDYFTYSMQSTKHLKITQHYNDFDLRQAILVDDGEQPVTFTLIDDPAQVVAEAIDYEGVWPTGRGVAGWQTTSAEVVRIGERLRGGKFTVHRVHQVDLDAGNFTSPWCPHFAHPSNPEDQIPVLSRKINLEALKDLAGGEWVVTEEWNSLVLAFSCTDPVEFLAKWWEGRS
ncbi:hypothetical protein BO71DRAFT_447454 [Aspergillus ellipticus CBS 707.79]|uniref:NmrA-like domain-containing protein n=1 Tax=Aspergillus ellipticus CBS 707.79 TaxID=1448320 RepID=A0A319E2V5_9EURO|nr:hypothetical protein BO71DRAFT_447454 [Aspergillus ellipticus CBS 707.79]